MKKPILSIVAAVLSLAAFASTVTQFRPLAAGEFESGAVGGKLVAIQVFSPVASGTVSLKSIYEAAVFTNAVQIETFTATNMTVVSSNRLDATVSTNTVPAAMFAFPTWQRAYPFNILVSSNAAVSVSVSTNTWPVFEKSVFVTNTIASGTCSGGIFTNAPSGVYLAPGEKLLFTGTATGGHLRLILE